MILDKMKKKYGENDRLTVKEIIIKSRGQNYDCVLMDIY